MCLLHARLCFRYWTFTKNGRVKVPALMEFIVYYRRQRINGKEAKKIDTNK